MNLRCAIGLCTMFAFALVALMFALCSGAEKLLPFVHCRLIPFNLRWTWQSNTVPSTLIFCTLKPSHFKALHLKAGAVIFTAELLFAVGFSVADSNNYIVASEISECLDKDWLLSHHLPYLSNAGRHRESSIDWSQCGIAFGIDTDYVLRKQLAVT